MAKTQKGNNREVTHESLELVLKKLEAKFESRNKEYDQALETLRNQLRTTVDQLALLKERNRLR